MARKKQSKATAKSSRANDRRSASTAAKAARPARTGTATKSGSSWAEWFTRAPGERRYWLAKSEPDVFSFDDLLRAPGQTTGWDGVRNYTARNFLRSGMRRGDLVFFYHSNAEPSAMVGICEVVREGYPDPTAFDPADPHFDPDSDPADPTWYQVDVRAVERLPRPVTLPELKRHKALAGMALLRMGRLSVTPVREREWETILRLAADRST